MKKILIAFAILVGCSSKKEHIYTIIKDESNPGANRCDMAVELPQKISLTELKELSEDIRSSKGDCGRLFISYTVAGIPVVSTQPWAKGHFSPAPDIEIFGGTIEQDKEIDSLISTIKEPVYKQYVQNQTAIYYLKKENDTLKVVSLIRGMYPMELEQPVVAVKIDGGTRYNQIGDPNGEHFRIYDNGDFGNYNSEDKKFVEAKLVK